jgi:hypothetical protein
MAIRARLDCPKVLESVCVKMKKKKKKSAVKDKETRCDVLA